MRRRVSLYVIPVEFMSELTVVMKLMVMTYLVAYFRSVGHIANRKPLYTIAVKARKDVRWLVVF